MNEGKSAETMGSIPTETDKEKTNWQEALGAWMQRRTERMSVNARIALWFGLVLLAGGYSSWLVIGSLFGNHSDAFAITPIRVPAHTATPARDDAARISPVEIEALEKFLAHMDSLARSPSGKAEYDRITRDRPGLLDSIRAVEQLYRLQTGKP